MRASARLLSVCVAACLAATCSASVARAEGEASLEPRVADRSLWAGARAGIFAPYGGLFAERNLVTTEFRDVAVAGPDVELDVGARFAQRFVVHVYGELAILGAGTGPEWTQGHGAQTSAHTESAGVALRWLAHPASWGPVLEVGFGYRWLDAAWQDGTGLRLRGLGNARLGIGMNVRLARAVELSPMLSFSTGAFRDRTFAGQPIGAQTSSYTTMTLGVGGHFDLFARSD